MNISFSSVVTFIMIYLKIASSFVRRISPLNTLKANSLFIPKATKLSKALYSTNNKDGHQSSSGQLDLTVDEQAVVEKIKSNEMIAKRLSMADEIRTLIDQSICFGTLSTNSLQYSGYPTGSIVGFELDENSKPFFVFSTMSSHTKDIITDKKASLTITAKEFKGAAEGRVVIIGDVVKVKETTTIEKLREKYLSRHKDAYWIDFGDFSYFSMETIVAVRYVGGFAMAGSVNPEDFLSAKPDPIASFAAPIMKHMNDDHSDSTIAMLKHYVGIDCSEATIVSLDSLGMTVKAKLPIAGGGYSKIRLSFPRPALERKAVKEVLVEMTKASAL